jgi:hypothetical protein
MMMNDATLVWGGDLAVGPTGDIALASGGTLGQQRVLRRLLTNEDDYVWNPEYGAGLGQFVGKVVNEREIVGMIKSQIFAESAVARQPDPAVAAETFPNGSVYLEINYVDALDGGTQSLTFTVGN